MMNLTSETSSQASIGWRLLILLLFLVAVNLLAGIAATSMGYPSLYNVKPSFAEYAVPLPFAWGFLHIPSMLIFGILLALLPGMQKKFVGYFRLFCALSFILLLLVADKKIPFLLYPKIDALTAFVFSLFIVPPNRVDNPKLVAAITISLALGILAIGYFGFYHWMHRTPELGNTRYADGVFELKSISVANDYRKRMDLAVDLKTQISEEEVCEAAQTLARELLRDYPFDDAYTKEVAVTFHPLPEQTDLAPYELGVISLNDNAREKDGRYSCYMKYKKGPRT